MGDAAAARAPAKLVAALGSGAAAGVAGTLVAWAPSLALLALGHDYASLGSVAGRAVVAACFIGAGVALAYLDLLPLVVGAGALVGSAVGALFGPGEAAGAGSLFAAFVPGVAAGLVAGLAGFALSLTQIPPLARREFNAYFCSPIAYVVGAVFLFLFGLFLYVSLNWGRREASLLDPMSFATVYLLPVVAPILAMRLMAEEKRSGTIEVLMTAPVRDWEVVAAKFLSSLATFGMMVAPTFIHVLALYFVSENGPATAPLVGSYLGLALSAALFLSLGLLASALARDQIVAAIVGFAFSFGFFFLSLIEKLAQGFGWFSENESARKLFEYVSSAQHLARLVEGRIDSRGIVYFLSVTVFVLFLTVRVVESRKWR